MSQRSTVDRSLGLSCATETVSTHAHGDWSLPAWVLNLPQRGEDQHGVHLGILDVSPDAEGMIMSPYSPGSRCPHHPEVMLHHGEKCSQCAWSTSIYKREGGPNIDDPRWQAVRRERLRLDPFCTQLEDDDETCAETATEVDHLAGRDYFDHSGQDHSWLSVHMTQALCRAHHRARTAQQSAAARQSRDYGT